MEHQRMPTVKHRPTSMQWFRESHGLCLELLASETSKATWVMCPEGTGDG